MEKRQLQKKVASVFRLRGLNLRPDAVPPLYDMLAHDQQWEDKLAKLLKVVDTLPLQHETVDAQTLQQAFNLLHKKNTIDQLVLRSATDAFATPRSQTKANGTVLARRLSLVHERIKRNGQFRPPTLIHSVNHPELSHVQLMPIDALIGRKGVHVVLGVLSETGEEKLVLEDGQGCVTLSLSGVQTTSGFFTSGSVVLAEGSMDASGVFKVNCLGMPPNEPKPQLSEPPKDHAMVIVASDLYLDQPGTLQKLDVLFGGYEAAGSQSIGQGRRAHPAASLFTFVLCGDFFSAAHRSTANRTALQAGFDNLAKLIGQFPTISKYSHFVIVPGPGDPALGSPHVLPRPPLPKLMCVQLGTKLARCHFLGNPARLDVCGRELVVFRDELLLRLNRCALFPPNKSMAADLNQHLVETVLSQAHLCPIQPTELSASVNSNYDHGLQLISPPDVLVLAQRTSQFSLSHQGTAAFNPGSFATSFSWMVFHVRDGLVEPSHLKS